MKRFLKSFVYAFSGIANTVKTQRNMRFHIAAAFYVTVSAFAANISKLEWFAVLLCFALVFSAEMFNTAIEKLCDTLHPEKSKNIGFVKDAAAGAVLISAIISAVVGILIFFDADSLSAASDFIKNNILLTVFIVCTLVPAIMFVSGRKKNDK